MLKKKLQVEENMDLSSNEWSHGLSACFTVHQWDLFCDDINSIQFRRGFNSILNNNSIWIMFLKKKSIYKFDWQQKRYV